LDLEMSNNLAPTDFRPFARFRRVTKAAARLAVSCPWAVPDAPLWAQQAGLEQIDHYFHSWDLATCARDIVKMPGFPSLPDGVVTRLIELVTVHCLPDLRYGWTFHSPRELPLTDLTVRGFAGLIYDSRYGLLPPGLGLASVARFMAEALLVVAHNGALLLPDEQPGDDGVFRCHAFDEASPYDWGLLWQSDYVVFRFFQAFYVDALLDALRRLQGGAAE
jgi:hypothetical protein